MSHFLIAYNNSQGFDSARIHNVIKSISTITDWWHYLPNVYIVSTTSNAKYLTDRLMPSFQGLLFLVVKLDMRDFNGVLNKDAWEWIRRKNNQSLKFKVAPAPLIKLPPIKTSSPLSDLLSGTSLPKQKPMALEEILGIKKK